MVETGTFLSRDPVESEPPYQYVHGNPINLTDPSGYQVAEGVLVTTCTLALPACGAAVIAAGATVGTVVIIAGPFVIIEAYGDFAVQHPELVWRPKYGPGPAPETAPPIAPPYIGPTPPACYWSADGCNGPVSAIPEPQSGGTPEPEPNPTPGSTGIDFLPPTCTETPEPKWYLYHYTDSAGLTGILATQVIWASLRNPANPNTDAQWGDGQYFTDISPQDASIGSAYQLSRALFNTPWKHRFVRNWVKINVTGLPVSRVAPVFSRTYGNKSIYLHPNQHNLNVTGRIDNWGNTPVK